MNRNVILAVLFSLVALDLFAAGVAAQSNPLQATTTIALAQAKSVSKLSFRLEALAQSSALRAASAVDQANALSLPAQGAGSLMRNTRGRLLVYIRMADVSEPQLQTLRAAGAQIVHVSSRYQVVTAYVDAATLTSIADLTAVQSVEEALAPMVGDGSSPNTITPIRLQKEANAPLANCPQGAAISEGDTQLNAASARSTYGIDGTGVKVGILSDSYDQDATAVTYASNDVASGDLPGVGNPCGFVTPVNVISPSLATGNTDEGRAMLQIVHDLAPGAQLSFASAMNGLFQFGDNIRALRAAGADIIADDVAYYIEPFYQEGPVSVAISDVVGSGALYFTAAGNANKIIGGNNVSSYEAPVYRPASCPAGLPAWAGPTCHDFDPSGGVNTASAVTLSNYGVLVVDFQWDEPWYGIATDLDIFLLNATNEVVAYSAYTNATTQHPYEYFGYKNTSGSTQQYRIVINRYSGIGTPRLKYVFPQSTSGLTAVQYNTSSGGDVVGPTLTGHSATHFGFSVAAVPYNNSNIPETYTSRGPAVHYFGPVVGASPAAPITPDTLQQPDFAATDGGCTTFFYSYSSGCYRFYGTSAAAPHAAAIAALLKQKANQQSLPLTRGLTQLVMQSTASAVDSYGADSVGAGLLNALAATQKLANQTNGLLFYLPLVLKSAPTSSWSTIVSTDFENSSISPWTAYDSDGATNGEYYWGRRTCRAYSGSYSAWGVGAGANGSALGCGSNYPNNVRSAMDFGPFSLVGATAADLKFKLWLYTESTYDYVAAYASIDGTNFYGTRWWGNSNGWVDGTLDLTNVYTIGNLMGQPNVWIRLRFYSDYSNTYAEGGYVDDVVLRKCPSGGTCLTASPSVLPKGSRIFESPAEMTLPK